MSEENKEKLIVTWDKLQKYTRELAHHLLPANQWNGIIAVSRGGLVPAAILARELGIRYIDTVCIASYHEHSSQGQLEVLKEAKGGGKDFIIGDGSCIVIDDLVDTGETAEKIREMYPDAHFVTIFAKDKGKHLVDKYIVQVPQDTWIELPWDMEATVITVKPICDSTGGQ